MKRVILVLAAAALACCCSCSRMDSNYRDYIDTHQTYSPRVGNLSARSAETGSLTLRWTLPDGDLARSIRIVLVESSTVSRTVDEPSLVSAWTFTDLAPQGYTFEVYTIDVFGNLSVPVSRTFSPIPHREGNDDGDAYEEDPLWFDLSFDWFSQKYAHE